MAASMSVLQKPTAHAKLIAAKVHCAAPQGGAHGPAIREQTSRTINQRRGTTFSRHTPPNPGFMRVSEPSSRRKCRRWVDLTAGAWLSSRILVSDVIRPRSFSPLSSALHRGRSALGFPEAPASPMWPRLIVFLGPRSPNRPAAHRSNDTLSCGKRHDGTR
jgi:hypothetical protein